MEKYRTLMARKYYLLSCHRYQTFIAHKNYEESLVLSLTNNSGEISFAFTDLSTNKVTEFNNPITGKYLIPLTKGGKMRLDIKASKAVGAYKIEKKTIR